MSSWRELAFAVLATVAMGTSGTWAGEAPGPLEDLRAFYHDVTLRLDGALPNENAGLGDDIELYLGVRDGEWRSWVLGYSVFNEGGERTSHYNFADHEGTLKRVTKQDGGVVLEVEMEVRDGPWVNGGPATYTITLQRDGQTYTGSFTGQWQKRDCKASGKGGLKKLSGKVSGEVREDLWPSPVAEFEPLAVGEHPRCIFRKSDLSALRERAKTPEGQAILARLKKTLDGRWTLWHGSGYGMLYQLTGERKYAEMAKEAVDAALSGKQQKDSRYSWTRPGGKLRAGPSYSAIALAYDLCYDAWPQAYRRSLAKQIQDKVYPGLVTKTGGGQHDPRSNHYGCWKGGAGLVILAIAGDPGTDDEVIRRCNRILERCAKRALVVGYGDRAFFYEGHHCGRISSNMGLTQYLQALRVAAGRDLVPGYEGAQWLTTKWAFEISRHGGSLSNMQRGMYARGFRRGGMSEGGDWAHGFGVMPEAHKPAVLWFYNRILEPGEKTYDTITYPHRGVYAFVNWPLGMEERDPSEVLGHVIYDKAADYFIFRSGWQGDEDIVLTIRGGSGSIQGRGERTRSVGGPAGEVTDIRSNEDNSHVVSATAGAMLVDFSGLSGAPAMMLRVRADRSMNMPRNTGNEDLDAFRKALGVKKSSSEPRVDSEGNVEVMLQNHRFSITTFPAMRKPVVSTFEDGKQVGVVFGRRRVAFDPEKMTLVVSAVEANKE